MKAATYDKENKLKISDIKMPELMDQGAIIKVLGCGLCGSDIVKIKEDLVMQGNVLGHEVVGQIVQIKKENKNLKISDRVVVGHHVPCNDCNYCKSQSYSMCKTFKQSNIKPGGFSEYIYVTDAHLQNTVFKLEDNLSDINASFTEPAACCLRAIKRSNISAGDNVFIIGLGSIGLIMGQIAKYFGANVIGCDLLDERIYIAKELGFNEAYKYSSLEDTPSQYKAKTNNIGADKVFLTSGSKSSLPVALNSVRDGGTIVVFSSTPSNNGDFLNNDIYYRELTVMGSYSPSPADLNESLNLIKNNIIKLDKLTSVYNIDNINEAISDTLSNKIIKAYIEL